MKTPRCNFFLPGHHARDHVLFHVILIVASINLVVAEVSDDLQSKVTDTTNVRRTQVRESKIDGGQLTDLIHQRSRKITNEADSPALRSFLKNILKARDELKWIDRAASRINYRNGPYGTVYQIEAMMNERGPSNDDRLNSNKNLQYERDNGENRWTRDYGVPRTNNEDSERLENMQEKRELADTAASLEELKETVLELRENLTRGNDDWKKDKPIIKINEHGTFFEDDLKSKKSAKDEDKKDTSLLSDRKHTERSNTLSNEDENTNLVWLKEPKFGKEVNNFQKTLDDAENQERSVILLRKKRMSVKNDFKNETNTYKTSPNLQKNLLRGKTTDINDYWRVNNYKEVSNVDDLIALQDKLLDYTTLGKETHESVRFKSPDRRLLSIVENKNKRPLINNKIKYLLQNHLFNKRKLLENDDENLEEDSLANDEATYEINQLDDNNSVINRVEEQNDKGDDSNDDSNNSLQEFDGKNKPETNLIDKTRASGLKRHVQTTLNRAKDPYEARVNMLIKQRIASKHRDDKNHVRKKRYPLGIIEYYDYDEEFENNVKDNRARKDSSNAVEFADENSRNSRNCTLLNKKNEHAEEQEKEERKIGKMGNKEPKQQFIVDLGQARTKNETDKSGKSSKSPRSKVTFKENDEGSEIDRGKSLLKEDEKSLKHSPMEWSDKNQMEHENGRPIDEHNLENTNPETILPKDSLEYIFRVPEKIEREIVDVIFNDVQPIDLPEYNRKPVKDTRLENEFTSNKLDNKEYEDIDAVYDELKKINDWDDSESKNGPRLKGDHRLYQESKNNVEKETNATLGTDYTALKKTDDLFKGGVEQSDIFYERSSPNSTTSSKNQADPIINSEWKAIPVMETINDSRPKSSGVLRSVESERRTKLEVDSGSPYENGKYLESLRRERNDNERFAIESNDMHESFVEPMDGVDDFDDISIRLGRSLKTIGLNRPKIMVELLKKGSVNETRDDAPTKNTIVMDDVKNVETCNDRSNETLNTNLSNLLGSDNRNKTIGKKPIRRNETRSGVNKINEIGSMSHSTLPSAGNKNASRVKREENSYSLTYEERNPFKVHYGGSNEIVNDLYTIDPYGYLVDNQNSRDYFGPGRTNQLKYDPIDFEANDYNERKKSSSRHRFKNGKRKKKKSKKKKKKNTNSRKLKKRGKNFNEINRRFERKNRRKRKSRNNYNEYSNRLSKKGRRRKAPKMLKNREKEKIRQKHGNSNQKIISGANVLRGEDGRRMEGFEVGTRRKKLALLLTADNMEDESQMDLALHGELPGKIVENIFEQVQRNEALKVALGPGLYRKNKPDDSTDKMYLQNVDEDKVRHTEKIMEKIMELLDRMVLDEVQKKTCVTLPSDMRQFLEWMLNVNGHEELQEQAPPLPLVHDQETTDHSKDDEILFPKGFDATNEYELNELHKKVRILKNLISEYNALSAKEKIKVQTVHDYLVRQLNLLLHYIETKEKAEKEKPRTSSLNVGAARRKPGSILRYQSAAPKAESQVTMNETLLKSNNSMFALNNEHGKRRPIRSSNQILNLRDKKSKKRKRRKGKRKHRGMRYNITPEYQKLVHRATILRKKRANVLEDEWNPFDFRYEEPEVYKSMSIISDGSGNRRDDRSTRIMRKREIVESNNATVTNLISNNIDLLPVKGKNRVEDEMILLNKREAWKKENERQLEEVAFGKDMRNALEEEEQFKKLTEINKNGIIDEKSREKRENVKETMERNSKDEFLNNSINALTIRKIPKNERSNGLVNTDTILPKNLKMKNSSHGITHLDLSDENKLKMLEEQINVYADNKNNTF